MHGHGWSTAYYADVLIGRAIELLAQQEPVAWMHTDGDSCCTNNTKLYGGVDKGYSVPLYASPPIKEPLSDQTIWTANTEQIFEEGVRWAEQQHKIGVDDE